MNDFIVIKTLQQHGIEIWRDYAVSIYTIDGKLGESFVPLKLLDDPTSLLDFLNY